MRRFPDFNWLTVCNIGRVEETHIGHLCTFQINTQSDGIVLLP